jgi:hypothetical protein
MSINHLFIHDFDGYYTRVINFRPFFLGANRSQTIKHVLRLRTVHFDMRSSTFLTCPISRKSISTIVTSLMKLFQPYEEPQNCAQHLFRGDRYDTGDTRGFISSLNHNYQLESLDLNCCIGESVGPFFFTLKKEYSEIQSGWTGRDEL